MAANLAFKFSREFEDCVLWVSRGDQGILMILYNLIVTAEKVGLPPTLPIQHLVRRKIRGENVSAYYLECGGTPLSVIKAIAKEKNLILKNVNQG